MQEETLIKSDWYFSFARTEMMPFIPNLAKVVLDVGCGAGSFGEILKKQRDVEIWGIELNANAALIAETKLDKILVGDVHLRMLELPDAYFDCIVFNDILEHLIDPCSILRYIKRVLKSEGVIVCSLPNVRYYETLKSLLIKKQWKYEEAGILDSTHLRFFTYNSILDMFASLEFAVLNIRGINPIKSREFRFINTILLGYLNDSRYLQFACVVKPL